MSEDSTRARERIALLTIAISVRSLPKILGTLVDAKLTLQQVKVLTTVVVAGSPTVSELAADFGVSMATMSKLIDRLVAHDVLERVSDPIDLRVRRLRVTRLGRDIVERVLASRPELGDDVLARLDADELTALERALKAVNRELQRMEAEGGD